MEHQTKLRYVFTGSFPILLCLLAVMGLLWGGQPASAQTCMEDRYFAATAGHLTCTANDVRIAEAIQGSIKDIEGKPLESCVSGQTFSFIADFRVVLNAQARYDIGLYFATDGDPNHNGALTGQCSANIIGPKSGLSLALDPLQLGSAKFVQLDAPPDTCGDINAANNPQIVTVQVDNVLCQDSDGEGNLNLPNCTSWRQTGANQTCTGYLDAYPGSPSKCNCNIAFNVPIRVETGTIEVTKDASPASLPEPGGEFTFTVGVANTGAYQTVTLERICDDQFGTVALASEDLTCPDGTLGSITDTNCELPQMLAPGASYSCWFTANVVSETPKTVTDTVTVYGYDGNNPPKDVSNSDSAQVSITNVPPAASIVKSLVGLQCADVKYRVRVNNTNQVESLQLTALNDNTFGNIAKGAGQPALGANVLSTSCELPQTIGKDGFYECEFTASFCGSSHTNVVTGTLNDNDPGDPITQDSNSLTINVSATLP